MDIQAYSCYPKIKKDKNPLQYVVSFNPPIMLTNYCMNPLEIFEIEDNCSEGTKIKKKLDQVAPSTSTYLIQLDITADNDAQIKLQIRDTAMNMKMTALIEDNDLD